MINVIGTNGEKLPHGILKMTGKNKEVYFDGFYYGNFFRVQSLIEDGKNVYKVLIYEEVYHTPMDNGYTQLITFIRKKDGDITD